MQHISALRERGVAAVFDTSKRLQNFIKPQIADKKANEAELFVGHLASSDRLAFAFFYFDPETEAYEDEPVIAETYVHTTARARGGWSIHIPAV